MKPAPAWSALLLAALPAPAADPERPAELTAAEVAKLYSDKIEDREEVWKKYDGKLLKLKGQATASGFEFPGRPKGAKWETVFALRFAGDPQTQEGAKAIRRNSDAGTKSNVTLYGRASFSEKVERPTKDYVVPDELKPKRRKAPAVETPEEAHERLQRELAEESVRMEKVLADARKKGQVETVTAYGTSPRVVDVVFDLKRLPPPK